MSISELARQTGIHKSHLARFELGEAGLGDDNRIAVAAKVGQSVSDLFPYPDTSPEPTCPSAANAPDEASRQTRPTRAETPSPAQRAKAPEVSARAGSHANE